MNASVRRVVDNGQSMKEATQLCSTLLKAGSNATPRGQARSCKHVSRCPCEKTKKKETGEAGSPSFGPRRCSTKHIFRCPVRQQRRTMYGSCGRAALFCDIVGALRGVPWCACNAHEAVCTHRTPTATR